ncbi:TRAP transporter solute receptor, TAXI family [Marinithermus hydrothermalis DSM 14884]|uniref:TRAP transporter solute receptor, TAXI family n=2 Tax=Marinithermus TaxID=186191 RepID=F2NQV8_MARHT|nr:TRAP transporter solute receptor, TAXI family [Marinithermus hydrothermalis DSM 14884]
MKLGMRSVVALGLLLLGGVAGAQVTRISIATGGTGGIYFPLGGGMAKVWTDFVEGVEATAEVTGASVENVRLVVLDEAQVALGTGNVVFQAYAGTGRFEGKPQPILAIGAMYPNALQIATLSSTGIRRIADLKGKRVSVGAPGSGTEVMTKSVLEVLGVTYADFAQLQRLSFAENVNALKDGAIDAGSWSVGLGASSLVDLATTRDMELVCMTPEEQQKVQEAFSYYAPFTIPAGTYPGVDYDCPTVQVANVLFVHRDADPELVYQLTRALYEHKDALEQIHPVAQIISPEYALNSTPIPFHPGALRYYEELGLEVPAALKPER